MAYFFTKFLHMFAVIVCITYLLASASYRDLIYITIDKKEDARLDMIAHAMCWVTIFVSLVEFFWVSMEVKHIVFPVTVGIVSGCLIPAVGIYGVIVKTNAPTIEEGVARGMILKYYWKNGKHMSWMNAVQRDFKCCGFKQFSDYREFIYNRDPQYSSPLCENVKFDIPPSCLDLEHIRHECKERNKQEFCNAHFFMTDAIKFINDSYNQEMGQLATVEERNKYKCDKIKDIGGNETVLDHEGIRNTTVFEDGCWQYIMANADSLRAAHHIIFFLLMAISFTMMIAFFSYWMDVTKNPDAALSLMRVMSKKTR